MRVYIPKQNLKCYADQYWPQKPIQLPNNPNIKFEHNIKRTNKNAQQGMANVNQLLEAMKKGTVSQKQEEEEYSNSAKLIYLIKDERIETIIYPGDWVVVYEDGMVVVKKNEQFKREYEEFNPYIYSGNNNQTQQATSQLHQQEMSSHEDVKSGIHNPVD